MFGFLDAWDAVLLSSHSISCLVEDVLRGVAKFPGCVNLSCIKDIHVHILVGIAPNQYFDRKLVLICNHTKHSHSLVVHSCLGIFLDGRVVCWRP